MRREVSEIVRFYCSVAFLWWRCFFSRGRLAHDHRNELISNNYVAMFWYLETCRLSYCYKNPSLEALNIFHCGSSSPTDIPISYPITLNFPYTLTIYWNWITVPSCIWTVHWKAFLNVQDAQIVPNNGCPHRGRPTSSRTSERRWLVSQTRWWTHRISAILVRPCPLEIDE